MKQTRKIIWSSLILGISCVYGDIIHTKEDTKSINSTKLELTYYTKNNISILMPSNIVVDKGEADNLSNYILKNLTKGTLPINESVSLKLCAKKTYILSVGINNYHHIKILRYSVSDAKIVPLMIERSCQNTEIKVLLDKDANKDNIIQSIESISSQISKEDTFILFYSGMGATIKDKKTILPVDTLMEKNTWSNAISLDKVVEIFGDKQANVFILMDTSFQNLNSITNR